MGAAKITLMVARGLVVLIALAVVGLSAWAKVIIHDMEIRGPAILESVLLRPESRAAWTQLFDAAVNSQLRIWVAIAASCFTAISTLLILLSQATPRMHMPAWFAIPLELITTLSTGAAFGAALSLTLKLGSPALTTAPAPDLKTFAMLIPLSKAYAITTGTGLLLLLITSMTATIQACSRLGRDAKPCSFEPTASGLGMGHGYQAALPKKSRGPIPTLYDPNMPLPEFDEKETQSRSRGSSVGDEEKVIVGAGAGAELARRDSANSRMGDDKEISGPLGLQRRPTEVANMMRPARPWSEMKMGR